MTSVNEKKTHFGYKEVPFSEKTNLVAEVFRSVAPKYDLMNDLMSFGLHRLWKKFTLSEASLRKGQKVLDVASGTGDLAKACAEIVGKTGQVILTDINQSMLTKGRDRLIDEGFIGNLHYVLADAEKLPFIPHYFDCVTIAFGLRNVTNKAAALQSIYQLLKPGGKLLVLEFSHPPYPLLNQLYDLYSFHVIPKMGEIIAHDRESYQYW